MTTNVSNGLNTLNRDESFSSFVQGQGGRALELFKILVKDGCTFSSSDPTPLQERVILLSVAPVLFIGGVLCYTTAVGVYPVEKVFSFAKKRRGVDVMESIVLDQQESVKKMKVSDETVQIIAKYVEVCTSNSIACQNDIERKTVEVEKIQSWCEKNVGESKKLSARLMDIDKWCGGGNGPIYEHLFRKIAEESDLQKKLSRQLEESLTEMENLQGRLGDLQNSSEHFQKLLSGQREWTLNAIKQEKEELASMLGAVEEKQKLSKTVLV